MLLGEPPAWVYADDRLMISSTCAALLALYYSPSRTGTKQVVLKTRS